MVRVIFVEQKVLHSILGRNIFGDGRLVLLATGLCFLFCSFFVLCTTDIADLSTEYDVTLSFADDTQLYPHCESSSLTQSITSLEQCVTAICNWMSANHLKLNAEKTELLWTGSKHALCGLCGNGPPLLLGRDNINAASSACLLGVLVTPDLFLTKCVLMVSRSCFFQLW